VGRRLPTDEEWEKAARGVNDTRAYPWGDQSPGCTLANYNYWDGIKYSYCVGDTSKVGDYPNGASPYGVMDMAGNVWEWIDDWHVTRSGSWGNTSITLRVSLHATDDPNDPNYRTSSWGFRCAYSP
jgi:formylglycine-generating enzyme required for sulfatase activity